MIKTNDLIGLHLTETAYTVESLSGFLDHLGLIMPLINALPNITFFVKNTEARYQIANEHLAKRCKIASAKQLVNKLAEEVFDYHLGLGYSEQDFDVMKTKKGIANKLELHSYQSGALGWCLTTKLPILNKQEHVIGVVGISIDLQDDSLIRSTLNIKLSKAEKYISQYFHTAIKVQDLADIAELSISQLDRQFKAIFQMTPQQLIQKKRLEHAIKLLEQDISITEISSQCGYSDHSAFTRKFKELTTMTPSQFKKRLAIM